MRLIWYLLEVSKIWFIYPTSSFIPEETLLYSIIEYKKTFSSQFLTHKFVSLKYPCFSCYRWRICHSSEERKISLFINWQASCMYVVTRASSPTRPRERHATATHTLYVQERAAKASREIVFHRQHFVNV